MMCSIFPYSNPLKGHPLDQPIPLPPEIVHHHPVLEPHAVLKRKIISVEGVDINQVLVWW